MRMRIKLKTNRFNDNNCDVFSRLINGEIHAESTLDEGTTFSFTLDRADKTPDTDRNTIDNFTSIYQGGNR